MISRTLRPAGLRVRDIDGQLALGDVLGTRMGRGRDADGGSADAQGFKEALASIGASARA